MKCPHCTVDFHDKEKFEYIDRDQDGEWAVGVRSCSACKRLVLRLVNGSWAASFGTFSEETSSRLIWPKASGRPPLSPEVPKEYAED